MEPWDAEIIRRERSGSLVAIARERRLALEDAAGPRRVDLTWVDEAALALVEAAERSGRRLTLVYPAPAGEVAVLLAAQVLLARFIAGTESPAIGLVTADPTAAARTWAELRICSPGSRTPISEVFPSWRADSDGRSPLGRRRFTGLMIGRKSDGWPVDLTLADHLAGPIKPEPGTAGVRVLADPLDPLLEELDRAEELLWGWSDTVLALWNQDLEISTDRTTPFSVAHERLAAIADGVKLTAVRCEDAAAESALENLREDLRVLMSFARGDPSFNFKAGLRVAWSHTATLSSLPCRPSEFDVFTGLPPRAARSTSSFEPEIAAWAQTLIGDQREYASVVASDLADLRVALDKDNPLSRPLHEYVHDGVRTLIVVRTRTAARALASSLGFDPEATHLNNARLTWLSALHRESTHARCVIVGAPPRSVWHRVDSGLSRDLHMLVLGEREAQRAKWAAAALRQARSRWSSIGTRERVWRALFKEAPPPAPLDLPLELPDIEQVVGSPPEDETEIFSPLGYLLKTDIPLIAEEGPEEVLASQTSDGEWRALVEAVRIDTDHGTILLPFDREVDVMDGPKLLTVAALELKPEMVMIIGRQAGRVGLLEALQERLSRDRSDLVVAQILVREYQRLIYDHFNRSGLSKTALHAKLRSLGTVKDFQTIRTWVTPGGPMGPRDFSDLSALANSLETNLDNVRLRETFAALQRIRTFRRSAGRALHRAATAATVGARSLELEEEFGLSVDDLRDAVIEARVIAVEILDEEVPLVATGRLRTED